MKLVLRCSLQFSAFLMLFSFAKINAQHGTGLSWSKKFDYQQAFIENRGQFIIPASFGNPDPVLFAVDHGGTKIYFTKKGITYTLLEVSKKQKDAREMERERMEEFKNPEEHARHEKEEHQLKTKSDQVTMLWQNSNDNVKIEASGLMSDYHNYSFKEESENVKNVSYVKAYKKITYKNLYPNIDVEYVFAEKGGLKYSLILHPGADPSQVKMLYDSHVSLNKDGEIRISTKFGDIIDHAPLTFYQQNTSSVITSAFVKSGKTVSFQLGNYDNTKAVVIDPWIQSPAFASNWDCVWECEKDGAGNVYMIGGVTPMQLKKYNSAGVLQWTYNTPYDTSSWLGTFAVDDVGNSYVTLGSTARIVKVSTVGAVVWNNTSPGGISILTEFWCITFNCDQTRLIIGGTAGNSVAPCIYEINMANGNVVSSIKVAGGGGFGKEVRAIAPSGNGRYYFLSHDTLGYLNQTFSSCPIPSSAIYKTTNTYDLSYKCENWRYDNTGIAALKANTSFVYVNRGNRLDKRSLATGAIIASVAIPGGGFTSGFGGSAVQNSGIDLDDCGNIYVGSKNAIYKFDSNLNQLASYTTTYTVYDVHVATGGNIIACGSSGTSSTASRTGAIEYISAGACTSLSLTCCDANICQPPSKCTTDAPFNLSVATPGGTWSGTGITNASAGTFNPATAGPGLHVITYSLACGVGTTTINVSACGTVTLCINSGSLTASGGTGPYTWSSTTTTVNCSSCPGGNCIPILCAGTPVPAWTATGTTVAAPASTVFPIKVKDTSSGVTFTFTTLASIPPCTTTTCPTLTMSITSQTNVNCFGANTGTATVSTSGGASAYTYTWSPGNLTGASQSALSAGVYTISIKDANACTGTGTVTITQPTASLSAVISATTTTGCGVSTGGATVTASGGTSGYTYSWTPSGGTTPGVSNLGVGNNTVTVTDSKGCTKTVVANITTAVGPTLSVVSQTNVNCFGANTGTATVSASGGTGPYSYTWTPGNLTGTSQTTLGAGIYTINVADNNSCIGSTTLTITQPTSAVNAAITATTATGCGISTGGATVTAGGGTPGYTYSWTPSGGTTPGVSNLGAGNNTVTVTDSKGCTVNVVAIINSAVGPTLSIVSQMDVDCFGASTGSATIDAIGSGPFSYTWTPGNLTGTSQSSLSAGIYTINISDINLCSGTGTLAIAQPTSAVTAAISATTTTGCGLSAGGATVTANGGTPGYTYSWTPGGGTTPDVTNLPAGNNTVTVTDSKGCTTTAIANITSVGGPTLSVVSLLDVNCFGTNTGTATVDAGGGIAPYSYTWTPGNLTSASQTGLGAGTYTINFADVNSCAGTGTLTITQPTSAVNAAITATTATGCGTNSTGGATVTANGGTPGYTYSWTPSGGTTPDVTNLPAGNNTVTVTDSKGCSSSAVAIVPVVSIADVAITPGSTIIPCSTGTVALSAGSSVGGPYTYVWIPSSPSFTGTTYVVSNSGTYTVIALNTANGCTAIATQTITKETINASFDADPYQGLMPLSVTFTNTSTNPSGTNYSWDFGNGTALASNAGTVSTLYNSQGTFPVILTATNGTCIDTVVKYIKVDLQSSIIVPNVFTPNGDGKNDVFTLNAINIGEINLTVYDRWGLKMYESTSSGNCRWDGKTPKGSLVTDGTYFYIIKATGLDGEQYDLKGSINVFQ